MMHQGYNFAEMQQREDGGHVIKVKSQVCLVDFPPKNQENCNTVNKANKSPSYCWHHLSYSV